MKGFKLMVGRGMADHPDKTEDVESCLLPETIEKGEPLPFMKLTDRMEFHKVPGVSIAVINNYSVEWAKGYGVREAGGTGPVTAETLFQAASISKPIAAMAALHYVQTGLLDLDEDVNSKLRSWKVPENEFTKTERVSLRRLLSHSAGLTVSSFPGYAADEKVPTLLQVLNGEKPANSGSIRVDLPPGTQCRYSGGGYVVLQQLLEDVTGEPFPRVLSKTVLTPLEMSNSTYEQPLPEALASSAALGHRPDGAIISGRWHTYPEMAAAGLWSTPTDLARLAIEVQKAYSGLSEKVLSPDIVKQMLSLQKDPYGLGPVLGSVGGVECAAFGHSGINEGYRCNLHAYTKKGQGVVVMTNSDNGVPLIMEIYRSIAHVYGWPDLRPMELGQPKPK